MRTELKRCIKIDRRWTKNEVSRGSPQTARKCRPTSHKKVETRWVSDVTGWKMGKKEGIFWLPDWSDFSSASGRMGRSMQVARLLTTVTSHVRDFPPCHGVSVRPLGLLLLSLEAYRLLTYWNVCIACWGNGTGNDVVDSPIPGSFTGVCLYTKPCNPVRVLERHIYKCGWYRRYGRDVELLPPKLPDYPTSAHKTGRAKASLHCEGWWQPKICSSDEDQKWRTVR